METRARAISALVNGDDRPERFEFVWLEGFERGKIEEVEPPTEKKGTLRMVQIIISEALHLRIVRSGSGVDVEEPGLFAQGIGYPQRLEI
jgi:hypothetical protein